MDNARRTLILLLLVVFTTAVNSFSQDYLPTSTADQIVKHTYYALSYAEAHEQPEWVVYRLKSEDLAGKQPRTDNFRSDSAVSSGSAALADYKGSGYDRGHLCPAGDMTRSQVAMSESFFMSNMSPQVPGFNRGIWKELEALVRDWADQEQEIIVVTGPIFSDNIGSIGINEVTVPGYYYKVIYDVSRKQKMIGFILPNGSSYAKATEDKDGIEEYAVSVDDVENATGIDFFYQMLRNRKEEKLESGYSLSEWGFASGE